MTKSEARISKFETISNLVLVSDFVLRVYLAKIVYPAVILFLDRSNSLCIL